MPKKQNPETPEEQSERFKRDAERLIEAGELDPGRVDLKAGLGSDVEEIARHAGPSD